MSMPVSVLQGALGKLTIAQSAIAAGEYLALEGTTKLLPATNRVHGMIGFIPLYNVTKYTSTDAARPLYFRPSGEVFMSAREGGSLRTIRLEMFVTGPFALIYIQMLRMLKDFGTGSVLSKLSMSAAGVPLPFIQQAGLKMPIQAEPLRFKGHPIEFTYPFITRTEFINHARIDYLHIEREVQHGINFGYVVKLDIVKVDDPFYAGKDRIGVQGKTGINVDVMSSLVWAVTNTVGLIAGENQFRRYRSFGPMEIPLLQQDPLQWKTISYLFSRTIRYEDTQPSVPSPSTTDGSDSSTASTEEITDPSGRFSGTYFLGWDSWLNLENLPLKITLKKDEDMYDLFIFMTPQKPSGTNQLVWLAKRMACYTGGGNPQFLGKQAFTPGVISTFTDRTNRKKINVLISDFSWPIDANTKNIATVKISFKIKWAIQ